MTGDLVIAALRRTELLMPIPPDWHIIKIDERQHWRDDLRAKTTAIYSVYALDRSSRTFICEATPSYALWWIGYDAEPIDGLSDEDQEALFEAVECSAQDQAVDYMHVSRVDLLRKERPDCVRKVTVDACDEDDDDRKAVDEIMEGWNTGTWRF